LVSAGRILGLPICQLSVLLLPRAASSMQIRLLVCACALLFPAAGLIAATFTTVNGDSFEAEVKDLYGDTVLFGTKQGTRSHDLASLDDASLRQVAAFLSSRPQETPRWAGSSSVIAKSVSRKLQLLNNGRLVEFDPADRPEPEFYVIYYGALWCGPCRRFSPRMVEAYQRLKALAPDRFEVIFVSSDENLAGQVTYAKEVPMPWPILKFSQAKRVAAFEKWRADGIPSVVVLNRDGDALFHSYRGKEYLGPDDPVAKLTQLLQITSGSQVNAPRPGRHRLAVAQHLLAANGGRSPAKPYLVGLERGKLRTLPSSEIRLKLTVDPRGLVENIEFLTQLEAVHKEQLRRTIVEKWLFLPAVENGRPRPSVIVVPLAYSAS
jgi:thiol-disulfide isomerase/thioredoxin